MNIILKSFGFKYGVPENLDFMFDVRCLPNPYWQPHLKEYCGLDESVVAYLENIPVVQALLSDTTEFVKNVIPRFEQDGRDQLIIGIGCTGGQHRSVYVVEQIAKQLKPLSRDIRVEHTHLAG